MTLDEMQKSTAIWLTAVDVAVVLGSDPNSIRMQAHQAPEQLGFPVSVCGSRVRIPRIPFLRFIGVA